MAKQAKKTTHPLIGMFFHTFNDDGHTHYQGRIVRVGEGIIIGQLYSWADGAETNCQIFDIDEIKNWKLYTSDKAMNEHYLNRLCQRDRSIALEKQNKDGYHDPRPKPAVTVQ